jgi:hypothetical protein
VAAAVAVLAFTSVDAVVVVFMATTMAPPGRRVACEGGIIALRRRNDVEDVTRNEMAPLRGALS